jgi:2-dehydro-3-deoxygluconokinase
MSALTIPPAVGAKHDFLALGALVTRLDPGIVPFSMADRYQLHVSGGEYNVAANLARCFGMRTAIASAMVDRLPVALKVQNAVREAGVEAYYARFEHDGVRGPNIAQVWSDRGKGVRAPVVFYNRANEAAALLGPGSFDWDEIFGPGSRQGPGVRWFHSGGIFSALSPTTPELVIEAMRAAKKAGAVTSFDLNYRAKLWAVASGAGVASGSGVGSMAGGVDEAGGAGGKAGEARAAGATTAAKDAPAKAQAVLCRIAQLTDVLVGNEEDLQLGLGLAGPSVEPAATSGGTSAAGPGAIPSKLDPTAFLGMMAEVKNRFPNIKAVATTLREVHSTDRHDWSAVLWLDGRSYVAPTCRLDVYDRVGGGDGFAAGLFYGLMSGRSPAESLALGWAHGALLTTFPGDTTMATLDQVEAFAQGGSARIQR